MAWPRGSSSAWGRLRSFYTAEPETRDGGATDAGRGNQRHTGQWSQRHRTGELGTRDGGAGDTGWESQRRRTGEPETQVGGARDVGQGSRGQGSGQLREYL